VLWALSARREPPVTPPVTPVQVPARVEQGWAVEDYDVIEAVVRHVLKGDSGLVDKTIFLSSPGNVYPGDDFMKRFADCRQRIRFVGTHKLTERGDYTYVDGETGEETSILTITVQRRVSANELEVAVSLYAGPEGAERYTCRVVRDGPDKPWVVHEPKVKDVS